MKKLKLPERFRNVWYYVSHSSAAIPSLILLAFLLIATSDLLRSAPARDAIDSQVFSDMMFGADDYFGANSDLSSVDRAVPSVNQPAPQPVVVTPTAVSSSSSSDSGTANPSLPPVLPVQTTAPSSGGGSSGGGSSDGGTSSGGSSGGGSSGGGSSGGGSSGGGSSGGGTVSGGGSEPPADPGGGDEPPPDT